ncbi:hypothetical protein [Burkholderia pseudomallei]|uniref:hypothetical protein n=1 Tax=Burkholderia pseudomallei TaxID=28450 RepID=UPI0028BF4A99|nr:hypothetical protein [Burkholderia pseudomallei]
MPAPKDCFARIHLHLLAWTVRGSASLRAGERQSVVGVPSEAASARRMGNADRLLGAIGFSLDGAPRPQSAVHATRAQQARTG